MAMEELVTLILKAIVEKPREIRVSKIEDNGVVSLRVRVSKQDIGKVIGRGGRVIKAIRNVVRIKAIKVGRRLNLELAES